MLEFVTPWIESLLSALSDWSSFWQESRLSLNLISDSRFKTLAQTADTAVSRLCCQWTTVWGSPQQWALCWQWHSLCWLLTALSVSATGTVTPTVEDSELCLTRRTLIITWLENITFDSRFVPFRQGINAIWSNAYKRSSTSYIYSLNLRHEYICIHQT